MTAAVDAIAIDLDGTLLGRDGRVSAANVEALHRARQSGIEIVIATGRALTESMHALQAIEHEGFVVHGGGSMISCMRTGRTVKHSAMCDEIVGELVTHLVMHGHRALLLKDRSRTRLDYVAVGGGAFDPASEWWIMRHGVRVIQIHDFSEDPHPAETVRVGAVARADVLAPLAESLHKMMGNRCQMQHWSAVTESHATGSSTHLLEAFARHADKSAAFQHLCAERGIDWTRTAAIGDGLNDVEIVRDVAIGIGMQGGDERLIAVADELAPPAEEDGVAYAIDRLLTGSWSSGAATCR